MLLRLVLQSEPDTEVLGSFYDVGRLHEDVFTENNGVINDLLLQCPVLAPILSELLRVSHKAVIVDSAYQEFQKSIVNKLFLKCSEPEQSPNIEDRTFLKEVFEVRIICSPHETLRSIFQINKIVVILGGTGRGRGLRFIIYWWARWSYGTFRRLLLCLVTTLQPIIYWHAAKFKQFDAPKYEC